MPVYNPPSDDYTTRVRRSLHEVVHIIAVVLEFRQTHPSIYKKIFDKYFVADATPSSRTLKFHFWVVNCVIQRMMDPHILTSIIYRGDDFGGMHGRALAYADIGRPGDRSQIHLLQRLMEKYRLLAETQMNCNTVARIGDKMNALPFMLIHELTYVHVLTESHTYINEC